MQRVLRYRSESKKRGGERSGKPILFGLAAAVILLSLFIIGISVLIANRTLPFERVNLIGKGCFALASLAGCFLAAKRTNKRRFVKALIAGVLFLIVCCGINIMMNGMQGFRLWIPAMLCILSVMIASLLSMQFERHGY